MHSCVECHLIADYQAQQMERDGTLDKLSHMYKCPDIQQIGIALDVPQGLVVKESRGPAKQAGLLAGDRIAAFEGTAVWTFGDLQYRYSNVKRDSKSVAISISREGKTVDLTLHLPDKWWRVDLEYRYWSIDPVVYYKSRPLTAVDKRRRGLNPAGFASTVTYIHPAVELLKCHELQVGDIVCAVDEIERDEMAETCVSHIKLRKRAGETVTLTVLRGSEILQLPLKTGRNSFRK
jgi:S1-C subfamily serine protease